MKIEKNLILPILVISLVACGGKQSQQATTFNPGASPERRMDEERDAKLAAKKTAYNVAQNPIDNLELFEGKIKLTIMVPIDDFSSEEARQIESKMIQLVTANGIGGLGGNPRYIIAPEVNVIKKEITSTAPIRYLITYDITFYVADLILGTVFASSNIKVSGVGDSDILAFMAAFNDLKPTNPQFQQMLIDAQSKIIDYYQQHSTDFIKEAKMLAAKGEIAEAMALLGAIPTEVGETYEEAVAIMNELLPKYLDQECGLALAQFKAAIGKQKNGINKEAMAYYAMIPTNSSCKEEAEIAYNAYKAQLSTEDLREWERENTQIKADNEYRTLRAELEAKIQITGNKCLMDKYKKDAAYNRLPWIRRVFHLGDLDPFDGYTPEKEC